jgi:hypothetical protein
MRKNSPFFLDFFGDSDYGGEGNYGSGGKFLNLNIFYSKRILHHVQMFKVSYGFIGKFFNL